MSAVVDRVVEAVLLLLLVALATLVLEPHCCAPIVTPRTIVTPTGAVVPVVDSDIDLDLGPASRRATKVEQIFDACGLYGTPAQHVACRRCVIETRGIWYWTGDLGVPPYCFDARAVQP